jgi:hypothetical protein
MPTYSDQRAEQPKDFNSQLVATPRSNAVNAPPAVEDSAPEELTFWGFIQKYPQPEEKTSQEMSETAGTSSDGQAVRDKKGDEVDRK